MMIVELIVVVTLCSLPCSLGIDSNAPPSLGSWSRAGVHHSQQSVHSLLVSLEERLRNLDNMRYSATRWEMTLDTLNRRIETLEARVTRAQTAVQLKIDTMSQTIISCELKDDLARDQLGRKFESGQERLIHRIGYVETRLEAAINKLQGTVETGFGKLESRTSDLESELAEIASTVDEVKSHSFQWEEKSNQTLKTLVQYVQNSQNNVATYHQADKIAHLLYNIQDHVNKTKILYNQNDGPNNHNLESVRVREDIVNEAQKIGKKVNNMYDDLWRKILSLEELVRTAVSTTNITRMELQEEIRSFLQDNREADANDNFIEIAVGSLVTMMQRKLNDLGRKVENNFQRVQTTQNMFMETCHRLQEDEPQLESKVSFILEKILDTILNRTTSVNKQLVELLEAIKGHNSQVIRTVTHTTNMVATLAEESSQDHKQLDGVMFDLNERVDVIVASLQEFQDQIQENINETLSKCYLDLHKFSIAGISGLTSSTNTTPSETALFNEKSNEQEEIGSESFVDKLNAVDATYDQGVVKILTEIVPTENGQAGKNATGENHTGRNNPGQTVHIPVFLLNKSLEMGNITAIISEPIQKTQNITSFTENSNNRTDSKHFPSTSKTDNSSREKEVRNFNHRSERRHWKHGGSKNIFQPEEKRTNTTAVEQNSRSISESSAMNIMMLYMRVLKGQMSKADFLKEANPKHPYSSIEELIKSVKGSTFLPREFLVDLERWDGHEIEKNTDRISESATPKELKESLTDDYNYEDFDEDY